MSSKPHIVFCFSDQHNPDVMGWRGDPWVRTPHLDQLRAEGCAQEACYCASPLCVPSRCSLLSTRLPQNTGLFINDQCLPSDKVTFAHELANAGYRTVLAGRMHFKGPDMHHGFHERWVGDIGDPSFAGKGQAKGSRKYKIYGAGHASLEESGPGFSRVMEYDQAVLDGACQRLEDYAAGDVTDPLFLTVGFYGPHNPYVCEPERYQYYYDTLPRTPLPALPEDLHPTVRAELERLKMTNPDPEAVHRSKAAYYGLVQTLDDHVGRLRERVAATLGDNVIFIYASDHGDLAGAHGTFWKTSFYEESVRVPMIWSGPGIPRGHTIDAPSSLLDFGVSLISQAEGNPMPETDGQNLWPAIQGHEEADPQRSIFSQYANRKPNQRPAAMIRKGNYKLIYHDLEDARPQLFDLEQDPKEQQDLGVSPSPEQARMIQDLTAELLANWDPKQADQTAKAAAVHMRRLHAFDSQHPFWSYQGWKGSADEH